MPVTLTWTVDELEYRFPSVTFGGGLAWIAWHSCSEHTDWLDGRLVKDGEFLRSLDIVAINSPDEDFEHDDFDLEEIRRDARAAWDAGGVLVSDIALIVPTDDLTADDIIAVALTRFRP
jgi:hypothetical protein